MRWTLTLFLFTLHAFLLAQAVDLNPLFAGKNAGSEGPRERLVDGKIHLTITGVKDYDYAQLAKRDNIEVLQMANPDVTDATLVHLAKLKHLTELDLNETQITDKGLVMLAKLPALEALRLRNTKITDAGFRKHLLNLDRLLALDLTDTKVTLKTVREWRALKDDGVRRVVK